MVAHWAIRTYRNLDINVDQWFASVTRRQRSSPQIYNHQGKWLLITLANHFRSSGPLAEADEQSLRVATGGARHLAKRDHLLRAGDSINTVFVLESGWAASFITDATGRRCITAVLLPGDLIGSSALTTGVATESVIALTPITVLPTPAATLLALMHKNVDLYKAHLARVENARVALAQRLFMISRSNAVAVVAHLLVDLATRCTDPHDSEKVNFRLHLTQEQIGDCCGLTPVHTNRTIRQLEHLEALQRQDGLTVVDVQRLRALSSDEAHLMRLY